MIKNQPQRTAVAVGVGLALASVVAAIASVLGISLVLQALDLFGTDLAFIIQYTSVQVGFLVLPSPFSSISTPGGNRSRSGTRPPGTLDGSSRFPSRWYSFP